MKKRMICVNVFIIIAISISLTIGLWLAFSNRRPKNLEETTGIIAEFHQRDEHWYDYLLGGSSLPPFDIRFEDSSYFEATGIAYENIDRQLFEDLKVGDEITITHDSGGFWRPDRIYAIEYHGRTYSSLEEVLSGYENNTRGWSAFGLTLAALSVPIGGIALLVFNYRWRKKLSI